MPLSLNFLLLLLLPLFTKVLLITLAVRGLMWWRRTRQSTPGQRPRFWQTVNIVLAVLAALGLLGEIAFFYRLSTIKQSSESAHYYRQSRERFVLSRDFQYGELLVPQGSLINRYGHDDGEPQAPLGLRGLEAVRFPKAVQVGNVWAAAVQIMPERMELATDQRLGPLYHFDAQANNGYGDWVPTTPTTYVDCLRGDIASFHTPEPAFDVQAEITTGPPDGAQARFAPSTWRLTGCASGKAPLWIEPLRQLTPPAGADAPIWAAPTR